ncbi:MAG: hypothetical protein ACO3YO_02680 [Chthoniobacterales bacterium]|jgi:hypothetical protein
MNEILLFIGLVVLTAAFLSYAHPVLRRLGILSVGVTSFAAGYLLSRSVWIGAACAAAWLFLPWVEILLRVRKLRLPLRKQLRQSTPPSRDMFPELSDLSDEIEAAGFEHVADLGWDMDGYRQFLRLFAHPDKREEAAITYVEQNQLGFHFASVTSRGSAGDVFTTWNCPVSSSLKTPPTVHLHRVAGEATFKTLVAGHGEFLGAQGPAGADLQPVDPDKVRAAVERDMETQMQHNIREGLLEPADDGHGRYSWRGMLYLWWQFVRDIFRFS